MTADSNDRELAGRSSLVDCDLAGPAVDVVGHVLAHVAPARGAGTVVQAGSLFDARYVAWAAACLGPEAVTPATRDALLLGELLAAAPNGHLLQGMLDLHRDLATLQAGARLAIGALGDGPFPSTSWAREALCVLASDHAALVEITRCAVALAAPAYAHAWRAQLAPGLEASLPDVVDCIVEVSADLPSLREACVRISHSLGPRGRGLPGVLLVGAPASWNGMAPATTAALAAHEHAVQIAGDVIDRAGATRDATAASVWALSEHLAVRAIGRRLGTGRVAEAHRAHLAQLDTSALDVPALDVPARVAGDLLEEVLERLAG